jgi:hypothetical protein
VLGAFIVLFNLFILFNVCLVGWAAISFFRWRRLGGKIAAAKWSGVAVILLIEAGYIGRCYYRFQHRPPSLSITSLDDNWRSITVDSDQLSTPWIFRSDADSSSHPADVTTFGFHVTAIPIKEGDYRVSIEFADSSTVWARFHYPGAKAQSDMDISFERPKPNEVAFTEEVNGKMVFRGSVDPAQTRADSPYWLVGVPRR